MYLYIERDIINNILRVYVIVSYVTWLRRCIVNCIESCIESCIIDYLVPSTTTDCNTRTRIHDIFSRTS